MQILTQNELAGIEKASHLDREWFERRPDRRYRLRKYLAGEVPFTSKVERDPNSEWADWTVVKQAEPGIRFRVFCAGPREAVPIESDPPIAALFDYVVEHAGVDDWDSFRAAAQPCFVPASNRRLH